MASSRLEGILKRILVVLVGGAMTVFSGGALAASGSGSTAEADPAVWSPAPAPATDAAAAEVPSSEKSSAGRVLPSDVVTIASDETCADGKVCFWRLDNFEGAKIALDANDSNCCDWKYITGFGEYWRSAKNRTGNRKLQLGDALVVSSCLDPGENRPNADPYDRARIGSQGSRCP